MKNSQVNCVYEIIIPNKVWFTLKERCALKILNYKTSFNCKWPQPNKGIPEGMIGGGKIWLSETILAWLTMTDDKREKGNLENTIPTDSYRFKNQLIQKFYTNIT